MQRLSEHGIHAAMLTGDRAAAAAALRNVLPISIEAELLPDDKLKVIRRAQEQYGAVAMIGDGLNDAPALAAATVGVAMGCGADVSREAADVCLLGDDLTRLPWAVQLARQAMRTIRQNLFWAFAYNVAGIGLAATGRLNPIWAAAAMVVSSFFVISNSLRLGQEPA
jgi:P-type E1-E2 ATPase